MRTTFSSTVPESYLYHFLFIRFILILFVCDSVQYEHKSPLRSEDSVESPELEKVEIVKSLKIGSGN